MSKAKATGEKVATVSEDQDTEPRAWTEIHPERRGWVRLKIRQLLSDQRIPVGFPGMAVTQAERIEALYAALALLSESPQPERPKRGKRAPKG